MSQANERTVYPLGPTRLEPLHLTGPATSAAGLTGVKVALQHALAEMGPQRSLTTLRHLNQKGGIDCPGCAWPDPEHRSRLGEFCKKGEKAIAEEATTKRVDASFFARHSIAEIGSWTDYQIGKSGRLTQPMVLWPGQQHYQPIEWPAAFNLIAQHLKTLNSPQEAVFYTSGRSSNEAGFLYGLMARALGTNNLPDCSNMCHESSGVALTETLGIGKGSVTLADFEQAEVVLVIGQNPGTNHPRMLSALQKCRQRGGHVVAINPLKEAGLLHFKNPQQPGNLLAGGTAIASHYLQVKINEDVALLKLLMKRLVEKHRQTGHVLDTDFINSHTTGIEKFLQDLDQYNAASLLQRTGLAAADVEAVAELLAKAKRIIICWAMGLTQHQNGVDNIKECVNLLLLKGSLGKPGAGTCPVRGHSNVQGDRTVGITHKPSATMMDALEQVFGLPLARQAGMDTVEAVQAMHAGQVQVFMALGGNFASAVSDTLFTAQALQRCRLTVSISTKLNRTHVIPGHTALILPTLGRTEQDVYEGKPRFVTVENSMGQVHSSQGSLPPASPHLRSEPEIVAGIAHAYFGPQHPIPWLQLGHNYEWLRDKMAAVFTGFEQYNQRALQGFDLPNHVRSGLFEKLPGGKAAFSLCPLPEHPLQPGEMLLMTIRAHDQFNTTIYGLNDRYRGIHNGRRVLLMNPADMQQQNLQKMNVVHLQSCYKGVVRKAENFYVIPYDIPVGNLAAYYPETNVLIPIDAFAHKSQTPVSKSVRVRVVKAQE